ncbi:hypothetical protein GIB67_028747, partial [Kingdonia uniflora]
MDPFSQPYVDKSVLLSPISTFYLFLGKVLHVLGGTCVAHFPCELIGKLKCNFCRKSMKRRVAKIILCTHLKWNPILQSIYSSCHDASISLIPSNKLPLQAELIEPTVTGTLNVLKACSETNGKKVVVVSFVADVLMNPNWPRDRVKDEACWSDKEYCRATQEVGAAIMREAVVEELIVGMKKSTKESSFLRFQGNILISMVQPSFSFRNNKSLYPLDTEIIYVALGSIRHITTDVGATVVCEGVVEELAEGHGDIGTKELMHMSEKPTLTPADAISSVSYISWDDIRGVVEAEDDHFQMVRFYYLLTSEGERQNGMRQLVEEAVIVEDEVVGVCLRVSCWYPAGEWVLSKKYDPSSFAVMRGGVGYGGRDGCGEALEHVELKQLFGELGIRRDKRVDFRVPKVQRSHENRDMAEKKKACLLIDDLTRLPPPMPANTNAKQSVRRLKKPTLEVPISTVGLSMLMKGATKFIKKRSQEFGELTQRLDAQTVRMKELKNELEIEEKKRVEDAKAAKERYAKIKIEWNEIFRKEDGMGVLVQKLKELTCFCELSDKGRCQKFLVALTLYFEVEVDSERGLKDTYVELLKENGVILDPARVMFLAQEARPEGHGDCDFQDKERANRENGKLHDAKAKLEAELFKDEINLEEYVKSLEAMLKEATGKLTEFVLLEKVKSEASDVHERERDDGSAHFLCVQLYLQAANHVLVSCLSGPNPISLPNNTSLFDYVAREHVELKKLFGDLEEQVRSEVAPSDSVFLKKKRHEGEGSNLTNAMAAAKMREMKQKYCTMAGADLHQLDNVLQEQTFALSMLMKGVTKFIEKRSQEFGELTQRLDAQTVRMKELKNELKIEKKKRVEGVKAAKSERGRTSKHKEINFVVEAEDEVVGDAIAPADATASPTVPSVVADKKVDPPFE